MIVTWTLDVTGFSTISMTSSDVCASGCGSETYTIPSPTASVWPHDKQREKEKRHTTLLHVHVHRTSIERLQLRHRMTSRSLPYGKSCALNCTLSSSRMVQPQWSSYYYKLDAKLKAQYLEKVSLIKQEGIEQGWFLPWCVSLAFSWVNSLYSFLVSLVYNQASWFL